MPLYLLDIKETGGLFTVYIQKGVLQEVLNALFKQAKRNNQIGKEIHPIYSKRFQRKLLVELDNI